MTAKHNVLIGLGSNMDKPIIQLDTAIDALSGHLDIDVVQVSSYYKTAPQGYLEQDYFINAVAKLQTSLSALELLAKLQHIEKNQGKHRLFKDGPRTLDLDILYFDNLVQCCEHLVIPHPRIQERAFVLYPLQEIEPSLVSDDMLARVACQEIQKLPSTKKEFA